eukprot:5295064-Alexandrium_andersonii.AAC.1
MQQHQSEADLLEVLGHAEGTDRQRIMVGPAGRGRQRVAPKLIAAGELKLQTGYAQVLAEVAWRTQSMGPPG